MINSTCTHKEIFLREIISNASDAPDKLCYLSLTDENVGMSRNDFRIDVKADKDARTITVSDNGIGMTEEEMEKNLGVIANSGSFKFKKDLAQDEKEIDIIGQFGVGFYSAFTPQYGQNCSLSLNSLLHIGHLIFLLPLLNCYYSFQLSISCLFTTTCFFNFVS